VESLIIAAKCNEVKVKKYALFILLLEYFALFIFDSRSGPVLSKMAVCIHDLCLYEISSY